jgi:IMP cyclohydrolase
MKDLEALAAMEYPGRLIILGQTENKQDIIVYGVTGRSEPSRERRFVWQPDQPVPTLCVESIKEEEKNDPLRNYDAAMFNAGVAVSNGKQTSLIIDTWGYHYKRLGPARVLAEAFKGSHVPDGIDLCSYEPDSPNFTPRIGAAIGERGAALVRISKLGDERRVKEYFEIDSLPGTAMLLSTYSGENVPSGVRIPPSTGIPKQIGMPWNSAEIIAEEVYEALGPKQGPGVLDPGKDFRVGVAAFIYNAAEQKIDDVYIINRHSLW